MEMLKKLNAITEADIISLEDDLDIQIPDSYKKYLLEHSGGVPKRNNFYKELKTGGVFDFDISKLYGISEELSSDLKHNYLMMLGRIPTDFLPISDDGIGNYICIGKMGKYLNKVYIWWSEGESDENELPHYDNIDELAESFEDFVSFLQ